VSTSSISSLGCSRWQHGTRAGFQLLVSRLPEVAARSPGKSSRPPITIARGIFGATHPLRNISSQVISRWNS